MTSRLPWKAAAHQDIFVDIHHGLGTEHTGLSPDERHAIPV